jgi:hypothetical protein
VLPTFQKFVFIARCQTIEQDITSWNNHLATGSTKPRNIIMLSLISSAVLASSFAFTSGHEAFACCGGNRACAAPIAAVCDAQPAAPAAPAVMPDMAKKAAKPPATAQSATQRYRSYSYDTAPANRAPQMRSSGRSYSSPYDQFRADRKVRGLQ